jgi:hypothetical protein
MLERYNIFRYYIRDDRREVIKEGLTWEEVMLHMDDPETKFDYATSAEAAERTATFGPWWDCWDRVEIGEKR